MAHTMARAKILPLEPTVLVDQAATISNHFDFHNQWSYVEH
jgi:hypothetical protein